MSISLRNKLLAIFCFSVLAIVCQTRNAIAAPLAEIVVAPNLNGHYIAGVSTNTFFIFYDDTFGAGGSSPDAGTRIDLVLLDGTGTPVPNGLNHTSFLTESGKTSYGGALPSFVFYKADALQLQATSTNGITHKSNVFHVDAGSASRLIVLAPGETLVSGRDPAIETKGKTGTPTAQVVNSTFSVTVQLTDAQFNPVSGTNNVTLTGGSFSTIDPASQNLVGGQATFVVSISAPKQSETYTAASSGLTSGTAVVSSQGPESEKISAFPSPFNPHLQNVNFQFLVDKDEDVTLKVIDQFGQSIWEKSVAGRANALNTPSWDGKNERGTVVAAGAYYVLLEIDGKIKSKKKFGVTK